jgi:hypothetical protein
MPDTQWMERTRLARERSMLSMIAIAVLLAAQTHTVLGIASGLVVAAVGLAAREPRQLALAALLASLFASVALVV